MTNYGNCQLLADMDKLKENAEVESAYSTFMEEIKKSDMTIEDIFSCCEDDMDDEIQKAYSWLLDRISEYFKVDVFLQYIPDDAEGTDFAGEVVWCVEPELKDIVNSIQKGWTTWSTFS